MNEYGARILDFLFVGSVYIGIAIIIAMIFAFILRSKVLGGFWLILIIAIGGSVIGAFLNELLYPVLKYLANLNGGRANIFPPLFFSFASVYLFVYLNKRINKK